MFWLLMLMVNVLIIVGMYLWAARTGQDTMAIWIFWGVILLLAVVDIIVIIIRLAR